MSFTNHRFASQLRKIILENFNKYLYISNEFPFNIGPYIRFISSLLFFFVQIRLKHSKSRVKTKINEPNILWKSNKIQTSFSFMSTIYIKNNKNKRCLFEGEQETKVTVAMKERIKGKGKRN